MTKQKILIIGLVWPEPGSSAAGTRMIQLIELFLQSHYEVSFACAASKSEFSYPLPNLGVAEQIIKLNDSSFNIFLKDLNPEVVMFDRFMIEEQYGWRVQQECPDAFTVLDTEDLHFLRFARQQEHKKNETELFSDLTKRELASILRCDLSLIISEIEMNLLKEQFNIEASILYYLPFLENGITPQLSKNWLPFEERKDFIFIGNFLHEPNWRTVQVLKKDIWPLLQKKLPQANLNIYGAYISQKVQELNHRATHFNICGRAENARHTISKHRILLAPIPFGAGVKGKLIDAMQSGTPSVTTNFGAEGMHGGLSWNGFIEDDPHQFVEQAVLLYQDQTLWEQARQNGIRILNERYEKGLFSEAFIQQLNLLKNNLKAHRQKNFMGQLLHHHSQQSTKYMSLWIEEKNKHNNS